MLVESAAISNIVLLNNPSITTYTQSNPSEIPSIQPETISNRIHHPPTDLDPNESPFGSKTIGKW